MKAVAVLEEKGECHIQVILEEINRKHGGHHLSTDNAARQSISKFLREFNIAESVNGLPTFKLLPDYKSRVYRLARKTSPFRARMNSVTAKPF